jgi:hypothetical protein
MENSIQRQLSLASLSLAIGALVLAIPSPARADGCDTSKDCTYYDSSGNPHSGRCGGVGTGCGCVSSAGSQTQSACNS